MSWGARIRKKVSAQYRNGRIGQFYLCFQERFLIDLFFSCRLWLMAFFLLNLSNLFCFDAKLPSAVDMLKLGCSVSIRSVPMKISKTRKEMLARGIITGLACLILSITLVSATHFIPQGSRQVITVDHQIRRVLLRAQRENLRSGIAVQTDPAFQHLDAVVGVAKVVLHSPVVSSVPQNLFYPKDSVFRLSSVLNL